MEAKRCAVRRSRVDKQPHTYAPKAIYINKKKCEQQIIKLSEMEVRRKKRLVERRGKYGKTLVK